MDRRSSILKTGLAVQNFEAVLPKLPVSATGIEDKKRPGNRLRSANAIERARAEAEAAGYQDGLSTGRDEGLQIGLAEGREEGIRQGLADSELTRRGELELFVAGLEAMKASFEEEIQRWFEASEEKMTDLVMEAVRELLSAELSISRDSALAIVKEALKEVTHSRHARIRLNAFDVAALEQHRSELLSVSGSLRDIEFVEDASISAGCRIETDGGIVDATVDSRLLSLAEALQEAA